MAMPSNLSPPGELICTVTSRDPLRADAAAHPVVTDDVEQGDRGVVIGRRDDRHVGPFRKRIGWCIELIGRRSREHGPGRKVTQAHRYTFRLFAEFRQGGNETGGSPPHLPQLSVMMFSMPDLSHAPRYVFPNAHKE